MAACRSKLPTTLAASTECVPESLRALATYLERSLDKATSIVMMRHTTDGCTVYLGDPEGSLEDLKQIDTITIPAANGNHEAYAHCRVSKERPNRSC
ncbi:hypothetical protein PQR18_11435 [Paraburkholderia sediminicola]